jgi:hypothetical protein
MTYARQSGQRLGFAIIAITVLAGAMSSAHAGNVYQPGWNVKRDVPEPYFNFLPGQWGDSKRYWPDQSLAGNNPSHAVESPSVIYSMTPGSDHYHSVR